MEYFLVLAQRLNFTAVAERFYITQPTLSRQIGNLERELGTRLFLREKNTVALTPAGRELYEGLLPIWKDYQALLRRVERRGRSPMGELAVGLAEEQRLSASVTAALRRFRAQYPDVSVTIRRAGFKELRTGLLEGYFDVVNALFAEGGFLAGLEWEELSREPACLAVERSRCAGLSSPLDPADYAALFGANELILADSDSFAGPVNDPVEDYCRTFGLRPPRVRFVGGLASVPAYVAAGLGVTMANSSHMISTEPGVALLEIPGAEPYRKLLAWRSGAQDPLTLRFLELVRAERARQP